MGMSSSAFVSGTAGWHFEAFRNIIKYLYLEQVCYLTGGLNQIPSLAPVRPWTIAVRAIAGADSPADTLDWHANMPWMVPCPPAYCVHPHNASITPMGGGGSQACASTKAVAEVTGTLTTSAPLYLDLTALMTAATPTVQARRVQPCVSPHICRLAASTHGHMRRRWWC